MPVAHSPLRYPGGKQILSRLVAHLIHSNGVTGGTYVEPYAGGAGVALGLLFGEHVGRVIINDADPCIHAFWRAALCQTDEFIKLLRGTPANVKEWARQRTIYQHPDRHSEVRVGFATFFLNRCNRSGIIASGGPIGGQRQRGRWRIDARLNRQELECRIRRIAMYRDRITLSNMDALSLLENEVARLGKRDKPFAYLDPPYYAKGRELYLNYYSEDDHNRLAKFMKRQRGFPWILSYDNVPNIARLYTGFRQLRFRLDYSARERRPGSEILISPHDVVFPTAWVRSIPRRYISAAESAPAFPLA